MVYNIPFQGVCNYGSMNWLLTHPIIFPSLWFYRVSVMQFSVFGFKKKKKSCMARLTLTLFYSLQGNSGTTDIYNTKVRQKSISLI